MADSFSAVFLDNYIFMDTQYFKTAQIKIYGMTCHSCEIMLERALKKIPGVTEVSVNHKTGMAHITADAQNLPSLKAIEAVIVEAGYRLFDEPVPHNGELKVRIDGMNDKSCERLLREKLKLVSGVQYAAVHYKSGTANIYYRQTPPMWEELKAAVESGGFRLRYIDEAVSAIDTPRQKWLEIGASLIIIFALYKILLAFNIISLVSSASGAATLSGIFVIGLVAGTSSCLAVTGGLLLSVAAKYNEIHEATKGRGASPEQSRWQKFKPLLSFNIGRLFSYFIFGGLVGILGRSIVFSPKMTGYMNIAVALLMLSLALSILKIIPKGRFGIRLPKRFSHWIANLSESKNPAAPFSLGALTFFLPCGFTQSLQLVALASGSFFTGALTMFIFALGTLPALLGISVISSTAKGRTSRLFLRFSGALVLVLALFNLNSGLLLTGVDAANFLPSFSSDPEVSARQDPNVTQTADGKQVINMRVENFRYSPSSFTVAAGKPTVVNAMADDDLGGCTRVLTVPDFSLAAFLKPGEYNEIGSFVPTENFLITCSMGMVRAFVKVVGT